MMRTILWFSICVLAVVLSVPASATPIQWQVSDGGNGHWYEVIQADNLPFDQAVSAASALSYNGVSGSLVVFETATYSEEIAFVYNNLKNDITTYRLYWVGAFNPAAGTGTAEDQWAWITGEVVPAAVISNWVIDYWEGRVAEGIAFYYGNTTLGDHNAYYPTSGAVAGYVVEYVPEPATLGLLAMGAIGGILRRRK
jgi:hypothetical protein